MAPLSKLSLPGRMREFEDFLEKAAAPGSDRLIPGCVVVVANKDGIIYSKCAGTQSVDSASPLYNVPLELTTSMYFASCTKLMTSIAALQCIDYGKLSLTEPISTVLPEWNDPQIITGIEPGTGKPLTRTAKNNPTLQTLLNHSSGLAYRYNYPELMAYSEYTRDAVAAAGHDRRSIYATSFHPLLFEPSTSWVYGAGTDWAGQMIATVSKQPLSAYMDINLFKPLSMNSTSFRLTPAIRASRADMTMRDQATRKLLPSPTRVWPENQTVDYGGAGTYSCAADYIKLLIAVLRDDGTLMRRGGMARLFEGSLSDSAREALHTSLFRIPDEGRSFSGGFPEKCNATRSTPEENSVGNKTKLDYSIGGLVVENQVTGRRKAGSLAWSGLPNLQWVVDRESGLCLFYASQVIPPGDFESTEVFRRFEEAVYSEKGNGLSKL